MLNGILAWLEGMRILRADQVHDKWTRHRMEDWQNCSINVLLRLFSQKIWKFKISQAHIVLSGVVILNIDLYWFSVCCSHISQCHSQLFHPTGTFLPGWNRLCWPGIHHRAPNCQQDEVIKELQGVVTRLMNHCYHLNIQKKTYKTHQTTTTLELPCVSFLDLSLVSSLIDSYAYKPQQQSNGYSI